MSIEIRRVVRQIIAPLAIVLPCVALLAAEPAFAAAHGAGQNDTQGAGQSTGQSADDGAAAAAERTKLRTIRIIAPERAVATISSAKVAHVSPSSSLMGLLKNVPGFNVLSTGPGNLTASDTVFTLDGFNSDQVGTTFDGVPFVNPFLGGISGQGDNHGVTTLIPQQVSSMEVFSGANSPAQTSIASLGGTINILPKLPGRKFDVQVMGGGGTYGGHGSASTEGASINSGAIASLDGFRVLASFYHTHAVGPQEFNHASVNSYYLSAIQPTRSGEVRFVFVSNDEESRPSDTIPVAILQQKGKYFGYPPTVDNNWSVSRATTAVLSLKSLLNPMTIGEVKFFYAGQTNDRTGYANAAYRGGYLGYRLPTGLKSCGALNAYEPSSVAPSLYPNQYDCAVATQMFGSAAQGTQYQRYIDNYYNTGALARLVLLFPHNTVTVGADAMFASELSQEAWYGKAPVPVTDGYNMAWLEHDGRNQYDGFIQDDISLLGGRLHLHPGDKYNYIPMYSNDDSGYYYDFPGEVHEQYVFNEPSFGVDYEITHHLTARAIYGRTYKAPDISALYSVIGSSQVPAPVTVQPEYVDSIDAGLRYKSRYGEASVAVFDRRFQHIFSYNYNDLTGITVLYNSGTAEYKGFTLKGEMPMPHHMLLEANFGYTDAKYTNSFSGPNGTVKAGQRRPNVPKETGTLGLYYSEGPWYGSVAAHLVGSQYLAYNTGATSNTRLPAYTTLDANVAYTWRLNTTVKDLKLDLHADNLLDNQSILYGYIQTEKAPAQDYQLSQYQPPLFVGLTLTADFGSGS